VRLAAETVDCGVSAGLDGDGWTRDWTGAAWIAAGWIRAGWLGDGWIGEAGSAAAATGGDGSAGAASPGDVVQAHPPGEFSICPAEILMLLCPVTL